MKKKELLFLMTLLLVLVAGFVVTIGYPPRARLLPLTVMSLCGVLTLVELRKAFMAKLKSSSQGDSYEDEITLKPDEGKRRQFIYTTAWIGGFALMIWLLGFVIGLPLYVFAYVKRHEEGWRWAIILTVVMFVTVYVGFGLLLQTDLHEGLLFRH